MDHGYKEALQQTLNWSRDRSFSGWDPYDALRSPLLARLTSGRRWLGVLCVQLLKNSPFNLRPLLGVRPGRNPKGMGLFMGTYVHWSRLGGGKEASHQARLIGRWLRVHSCHGWHGPCWGFNFDWPNRAFFAPAGTPTVVNTVFIAHAFLDAYEHFGESHWLEWGDRACQFVLQDLNRDQIGDAQCFSYTPLDRRWVHNANGLAASLLARVGKLADRESYILEADSSVRYIVGHQRADGSWPYGLADGDQWVDSYHSGFLLNALLEYSTAGGRVDVRRVVERGYKWYKESCFDGPVPKMSPARRYPVDIHCAAQAILTFVAFRDTDPQALRRANEIAQWTMENLRASDGSFHFQMHRTYSIKTPFMRWSQAWMSRALVAMLGSEQ